MTTSEMTQFLDQPGHLVRIATVDDDGMPLVVPAWFIHEGGRLLVTPRERSAWRSHLQRDPRTCFLIDEEVAPHRKVVARGVVEMVHDLGHDDDWRHTYRAIALRYVPEAWADAYLEDTHDEPRALIALDLATADVTTWRMPLAGEEPLAVWAPRYYHRQR
jgi:nitroimidazol reductase NimA-like FMN-containing flavoprotein (pyridoxamine 5'-phosphate oxidase superfamily)